MLGINDIILNNMIFILHSFCVIQPRTQARYKIYLLNETKNGNRLIVIGQGARRVLS